MQQLKRRPNRLFVQLKPKKVKNPLFLESHPKFFCQNRGCWQESRIRYELEARQFFLSVNLKSHRDRRGKEVNNVFSFSPRPLWPKQIFCACYGVFVIIYELEAQASGSHRKNHSLARRARMVALGELSSPLIGASNKLALAQY